MEGIDSSPQIILVSYIGQLPYTTPDELNNISSSIRQLNLTDIHGKSFSSLPPEVLFRARRKEESDSFILSPRDGHINITASGGGKSSSESKGFVIQSNSGRRVVSVEEYIQLAERWRAKAIIALADEICAESCTRKRVMKATERSKQWFLDCQRLLRVSPRGSTTETYSPLLFGVPIFNRFNPETYKESINWLIDSGAAGIVVSCHTGEGSMLRREMIAQVQSIAIPRRVPIAIQGCDTLEHIVEAIQVGVDLISTDFPRLLTAEGKALVVSFEDNVAVAAPVAVAIDPAGSGGDRGPDSTPAVLCEPTLKQNNHSINVWEPVYERDIAPLVSGCGCHACMYYSRAYIHHLLLSKEMLAEVLLYNHNQYRLVELFQIAQAHRKNGSLSQWLRQLS